MSRIKIHDKYFEKTISYEEISASIKRVADEINKDYAGKRPLLLAVLNGSFMFAAELMKNLNIELQLLFLNDNYKMFRPVYLTAYTLPWLDKLL